VWEIECNKCSLTRPKIVSLLSRHQREGEEGFACPEYEGIEKLTHPSTCALHLQISTYPPLPAPTHRIGQSK